MIPNALFAVLTYFVSFIFSCHQWCMFGIAHIARDALQLVNDFGVCIRFRKI